LGIQDAARDFDVRRGPTPGLSRASLAISFGPVLAQPGFVLNGIQLQKLLPPELASMRQPCPRVFTELGASAIRKAGRLE
jgi:hypothetical protein